MIGVKRRREYRPPIFPIDVHADPWWVLCERAVENPDLLQVIHERRAGMLSEAARAEFLNADGKFYRDMRETSLIIADETGVTGAATDKLLYAGGRTSTIAYYLSVAKKVKVTIAFRMTTGATPGNIGVELYYGTTDAGGTLLGSSAAVALTGGKTNITCTAEAYFRTNAAQSTASGCLAWGRMFTDPSAAVLTNFYLLIPAATLAAVNIDSTAAGGLNIQAKNSGANASTYTTHEIQFEALN